MCVAHVNNQLYWSCHWRLVTYGCLSLPVLREETDGATETHCMWLASQLQFI